MDYDVLRVTRLAAMVPQIGRTSTLRRGSPFINENANERWRKERWNAILHGIPSTPSRFANRPIDLSLLLVSRRSFPVHGVWTTPICDLSVCCTASIVQQHQCRQARSGTRRLSIASIASDSKLAQSFWLQTN